MHQPVALVGLCFGKYLSMWERTFVLRSNLCALLNSMREDVKPFLVWLLSHRLVIFWSTVDFTLAIVVLSLSITRVDTFKKKACQLYKATFELILNLSTTFNLLFLPGPKQTAAFHKPWLVPFTWPILSNFSCSYAFLVLHFFPWRRCRYGISYFSGHIQHIYLFCCLSEWHDLINEFELFVHLYTMKFII